eukprot:TRINITY_DN8456_c0_g2_i1.p1 TRINITY_DN8456_c0_g2~~TRINITY_DN8456_c0_g2_i1.p1  ORF type:complete len:576 (+),score=84.52 TRINITY_DN8456_c0_g2_i1:134-1861(+)
MVPSPKPHVGIENVRGSIELSEGDSQFFTINVQAARLIQELLAKQLEQVKQALECNLQIANRLTVATDTVVTEEVKIDSGTIRNIEMVKDASVKSTTISGDARIADEDALTAVPSHLPEEPPSNNDFQAQLSRNNRPSFQGLFPTAEDFMKPIFVDLEVIKQFVRQRFSTNQYAVEDWYFTSGWAQAIAKHDLFKTVTLLVILLNTVWIGVDTDLNHEDILLHADDIFQFVQNTFCAFFTFEVVTRFCAFEHKAHAFKDGWFVFDSVLVIFMIWETWIVTVFCLLSMSCTDAGGLMLNGSLLRVMRFLRLLRTSRVIRLVRLFPELMVLLHSMLAAMRSVFWTLSFLFLIIYIFAVLFTQMARDSKEAKGCFEDVLMSMECLMLNSIFPDQKDHLQKMQSHSKLVYFLNLIFMALSCLTVMNLLIGVLCEVVSEIAREEKDGILAADLQNKLRELLPMIHADRNNHISSQEFPTFLTNERVCHVLDEAGIDVVALADHAGYLFRDADIVSCERFVYMALEFRDSNLATVKELRNLQKSLAEDMLQLGAALSRGTTCKAKLRRASNNEGKMTVQQI